MKRKTELSRLNIWFCLMVVLIHVLSQPVTALDPMSWQYAVVEGVQRLSFVSVPGFFMLSGLKLTLNQKKDFRIGSYYGKRVKTILLPYLIAVTVYILYFLRLGWVQLTAGNLAQFYLLGTISGHLYYIVGLVQFIILTPLWLYAVKKLPGEFAIPVAVCVTMLSSLYLGQYINGYSDRVFTSYLFFFLGGCYIGRNYTAFLKKLKGCKTFFILLAIVLAAADAVLSVLQFSGRAQLSGLAEIHLIYEAAAFFALLLLAERLQNKPLLALERVIDNGSYLIYLYHVLFIQIFANQLHLPVTDTGVLLVLRILFVYPATILAVWAWKKLAGAVKNAAGSGSGKT